MKTISEHKKVYNKWRDFLNSEQTLVELVVEPSVDFEAALTSAGKYDKKGIESRAAMHTRMMQGDFTDEELAAFGEFAKGIPTALRVTYNNTFGWVLPRIPSWREFTENPASTLGFLALDIIATVLGAKLLSSLYKAGKWSYKTITAGAKGTAAMTGKISKGAVDKLAKAVGPEMIKKVNDWMKPEGVLWQGLQKIYPRLTIEGIKSLSSAASKKLMSGLIRGVEWASKKGGEAKRKLAIAIGENSADAMAEFIKLAAPIMGINEVIRAGLGTETDRFEGFDTNDPFGAKRITKTKAGKAPKTGEDPVDTALRIGGGPTIDAAGFLPKI